MEQFPPTLGADGVKGLRERLELTPHGLAHALGITQTELEALESGQVDPTSTQIMAMLYLLEHPLSRPVLTAEDELRSIRFDPQTDSLFGKPLRDGATWGPWRFSADSMTLDYNSREYVVSHTASGDPVYGRTEDYDIALASVRKAEQVLDWTGQILGKGWGPAAVGYLMKALDDLVGFQGRLAHGKSYANADELHEHLRRRIAPR